MKCTKEKRCLTALETALLLSLAVTVLWGAWSLQRQDTLERKMIRLHVIANSDTREDQVLKLQVRDRILASAESILRSAEGMEQARTELEHALPELLATAEAAVSEAGYNYPVTARLERTEFPYKDYDGFALPTGEYLALRITLGEGRGQNWWCVVFPPLCSAAAADWRDTAVGDGLDEDDVSLISQANTEYVLKFRSVELWENIRRLLGG